MAVPYTFGSATTSIPLSQLDSNFATTITLGNTAVQLGNTITNLTGVSHVASATSLSLGSNGNTTAVTIDTSQNVGIGTASPSFPLQVQKSGDSRIAIVSTSGSNTAVTQYSTNNGSTYWYNYYNGSSFIFQDNASERMRIVSDGSARFSMGNFANSPSSTNAGFAIENNGNSPFINHSQTATSLQTYYAFINGNGTVGTIKCTGSSTQFNTSSDVRLKKNVVDAPSAIASIQQIGIKSFDWKADDLHQEYGLIAQELDAVAPEAVSHGATEDEMWGVDYSKLVPRMIKSIQELKAINDTQSETINALTARIVALESK